jgi:hypothetical protein
VADCPWCEGDGTFKLFALIHDDRFSESHDLYGIFSSRELADKALKEHVSLDERANRTVRIVEYEVDRFVKEGHYPEFDRQDDLEDAAFESWLEPLLKSMLGGSRNIEWTHEPSRQMLKQFFVLDGAGFAENKLREMVQTGDVQGF